MNYFKTLTIIAIPLLLATEASALTRRYRLMFNDDPATTITIAWDQQSGTSPVLHYGPTDQGTNFALYPSTATPFRTTNFKTMNNQFVKLTGLTPNTAYYFVIRDSDGTSSRFWFKTCPNVSTERLSFISGGDSRSGTTQRQNSNRMVGKLRPHAVLFGGDLTNSADITQTTQWMDDWQLHVGADGRMIPLIIAYGNHENYDGDGLAYNNSLFDVPTSNYFAVTFGGDLFRFYTLNTEVYPGKEVPNATIRTAQNNWLASDLAANSSMIWKSAQFHRPMNPHQSSKSNGIDWYNDWANLFYNNNVRLVIDCDAHVVKATEPVKPTGVAPNWTVDYADPKAITFVGEGSWGTLRTNDKTWPFTRNSASFYHFNWIFVDACKIEIRTIDTQNPGSVTQVSDSDIFTPPSGLIIWQPSNIPTGVVQIINCAAPIAEFTADYTTQFIGNAIQFSDLSYNTPTSWLWDFGDGNQSTLQNPSHTYAATGTYTVSLTATNSDGSHTKTVTNYITVIAPSAPVVDFIADATNINPGTTVNFTDNTTGVPVSWSWSFPGGTPATSAAQNPSVAYNTPGLYNVTLTATNAFGSDTHIKHGYIQVSNIGVISQAIEDPDDDVEERNSNGSMYFNSSDLELCYDGYQHRVGLRYNNIPVPQGATVTSSYIQFRADEVNNQNPLTLRFQCENVDNAAVYTATNFNLSSRSFTPATVDWVNPLAWNTVNEAGSAQQSPSLNAILQQVFNRPGWQPGNSLSFVIYENGTTNRKRVADSYEGGYGPVLNINFQINSALSAQTAASTASCPSSTDGSITANVSGGTPGYEFSLNGTSYQASNLFSNLSAGTYTVYVRDASMNVVTQSVTVGSQSGLTTTASATGANCNGGTGSASANATGGITPYTFLWNDMAAQTTSTATNLAAGNYSVIVTDGNGCQSTQDVTVSQPSAITATTSSNSATCGQNDGTATVAATGGTGSYTYLWNNGQTTATANTLNAGSYNVTVTDANNCSSNFMVNVSNAAGPTLTASTVNNVSCNGLTDGIASASATGGTGALSYLWSNGQTTTSATGLGAGSYTVTVTDANGCQSTETVTISEPSAVSISSSVTDVQMGNDGAIDVTASGGTPPYGYLWDNDGTGNTSTNEDLTNLPGGVYNVTVTDQNGCTESVQVIVGSSVAVAEIDDLRIEVYPNPSNGMIMIRSIGDAGAQITVFDLNGKQVLAQQSTSDPETIYLDALSSGVYILNVRTTKGKTASIRIVKE